MTDLSHWPASPMFWIPESGFPYMGRVAHLTTVNARFGSLCFDTNTPAFLMQIMLKNSRKRPTSFS